MQEHIDYRFEKALKIKEHIKHQFKYCPYCGEKVNTSVFDDAEEEEEGTDEAADIFADEAEEDAYGEKLKEAAEECADAVKEKAADVLDKAAEKMGEAADKMEETADKMKSETAGEDKTE